MTPPTLCPVTTIYRDVGVSVVTRFIKIDQLGGFCFRQFAVFNSLRHLAAETVMQQSTFIAGPPGSFAHRRAANHFFDQVTFFIDMDVGFIRCAKEVVVIAHRFLISADQHEREIVGLVRIDLVQLEHLFDVMQVDEFVDHAVRVTGDIAKGRAAYRDFLTLWKDADQGIPILKEAKMEYAKLQ